MIKTILASCLLFINCGGTKTVDKPSIQHQELRNLVDVIQPQLLWYQGSPVGDRKNNINGDANGDVGDSIFDISLTILLGNIGDINYLANTFNTEGQPFRAPSYVDKTKSDSYSRDQMTGMVASAAKTKNLTYLLKLKNYIDRTGKLCPEATGNKCEVTPIMDMLMKDTLGLPVTKVERWVNDDAMYLEAKTVPANYRAMLLAYQLFIKIEQGKVSQANRNAAKVLTQRIPLNLMFRTLDATMNGKGYELIIKDITFCLKGFKKAGSFYMFNVGNYVCGNPNETHNYWDIIALARYILAK